MALACRDAVDRDDLGEDFSSSLFADLVEHAREPVGVLLLDTEPALPFRVGEVFPRRRQLLLLHEVGVVCLHEDVEPRPHPFAVRADCLRDQVRMVWALHDLQDLLTVQRLQFRAVGLDDVDGEAAGAALLHRAVEHGLGASAPQADVDAVGLLERLDNRTEVACLGRGVDVELSFSPGALDEPLHAIGALVERHVGGRRPWRRRSAASGQQ